MLEMSPLPACLAGFVRVSWMLVTLMGIVLMPASAGFMRAPMAAVGLCLLEIVILPAFLAGFMRVSRLLVI